VDREGKAELLPGTDQIVFSNGFAFDGRGNLCVTILTRNAVVRLVPPPGRGRASRFSGRRARSRRPW